MLNILPPLLRLLDGLEAQAEEAGTRDAVLGTACSLSYRDKGGLPGVATADVPPVLCRKVIEGQQHVVVLLELFHRLGVFGLVIPHEGLPGPLGGFWVSVMHIACRAALASPRVASVAHWGCWRSCAPSRDGDRFVDRSSSRRKKPIPHRQWPVAGPPVDSDHTGRARPPARNLWTLVVRR
jgi:hypothetical protein